MVDVTGIGNSLYSDLPLVQAVNFLQTKAGAIIGLFNQYAFAGVAHSIHSSIQMEAWGVEVSGIQEIQSTWQAMVDHHRQS